MIDTKAIRNKILDLAVRGKLTEQLSEDGTTEELYRQIQLEKEVIIKERKGRNDKGIKSVDNDTPYLIPVYWKWIRFGEVGLFKKGPFGSALTKSMFVSKSTNAIKVYEQQHAIKKDSALGTYYITKEYFDDKMKGFEVKGGDIIISCAGTIGETYIMPNDIEPGIINQALMRVTLVSGIDKRFFQYFFDSSLKNTAKEGNGSAIVNIPPFDIIKNWYFPLPPLAEQKRIVNKIEQAFSVLDTIDELQKKYADNMTVLKSKLIDLAIRGKLTEQLPEDGTGASLIKENANRIKDCSIEIQKRVGKGCKPIQKIDYLFEIPETWCWERFGNLVVNYDNQRKPVTKSDRKSILGLYDYYGATGAIDRVDEYIFDGDYLMIGEDGGNFFVNRDNSFIAHGKFWANNHVHVVQPIICEISYLKICLDNYDLPKMGLIYGIGAPKLNQENMNSIPIPVPPLAEQKRIVERLDKLLAVCDSQL